MGNRKISERIFDVLNVVIMLLMIVITVYPIYYVLVSSLSDSTAIMTRRGIVLWPQGINFDAYAAVFSNPNILTGYRTTLFVVVAGTVLSVCMTALAAFLLTRKRFAIQKLLGYMMFFTMYFGGGMIPTYLVVYKWLGLGNNLWALILPGMISTYNVLIMRTNFAAIPESLEESAKIDGVNDIVLLIRIILPLSMPVIAVMLLFYGVGYWNAWFNALLYIRDRKFYPLQLILREILIMGNTASMTGGGDMDVTPIAIRYATIIVATVPILCVYPFLQRFFVKGVMIGAVKG